MKTNGERLTPKELGHLIDHALDPERRQTAYSLAKEFAFENQDIAGASYMLGLAAYNLSYDKKEVLAEAESAFEKGLYLGLNEWDFQMTVYHLGFVYFRQSRYQSTLGLLKKRNPDFFISIDQFWRIAKLDEIDLVCRYYLYPNELSVNSAEQLEKQYANFKETEDAPLLIEIGDCLSHLLENASGTNSELEQICLVVVRIIRHLDQSKALRKREGLFFQRL